MYGSYETYEGKPAVRFERIYSHPVERVWRSITVPEEMAAWFPTTVEVDLREGGDMRFTFPSTKTASVLREPIRPRRARPGWGASCSGPQSSRQLYLRFLRSHIMRGC